MKSVSAINNVNLYQISYIHIKFFCISTYGEWTFIYLPTLRIRLCNLPLVNKSPEINFDFVRSIQTKKRKVIKSINIKKKIIKRNLKSSEPASSYSSSNFENSLETYSAEALLRPNAFTQYVSDASQRQRN